MTFARAVTARWWALWAARLLGERIVSADSGYTVVGYRWRGRIYVTDVREPTDATDAG